MSAQRVDSLRLVWLQAFLAVAKCESHTVAAEELGWDQSTVSRYIKRLESWLGKLLFTGYVPPVITKGGKAFLPVAKEVLDLLTRSRTRQAIDRKHPGSTALAKEKQFKILKYIYQYGPLPGSKAAKQSGLSDEFLTQARQDYIKLRKGGRPVGASTAHIDISYLIGREAAEEATDVDQDGE